MLVNNYNKVMVMKFFIFFIFSLSSIDVSADSELFFDNEFKDRNGCFLLVEIESKEVIDQFNMKRCERRFPPMSTFKVPFVAMGFDSGYFKSIDQKIPWDGKDRGRKVVNKNQTPKTFIDYSVIWVSRKIIGFLGQGSVQDYVNKMEYGNKTVAGEFNNFWLSKGSIKVSAKEQIQFLSRLWLGRLPLSKIAVELTKGSTFDREINGLKVHGKTGTGCIDEGCMNKPGRQLGWYVGVVESKNKKYAFALNFSDKKPIHGYGGPKAKKIVHRYFDRFSSNL